MPGDSVLAPHSPGLLHRLECGPLAVSSAWDPYVTRWNRHRNRRRDRQDESLDAALRTPGAPPRFCGTRDILPVIVVVLPAAH